MNLQYTQICYVVRDLEQTILRWAKTTGAGPFYTLSSDGIPDRTYRGKPAEDRFIAAAGFLGTTNMEFVQPLDDKPSVFQEVLRAKGEAVHHVLSRQRVVTAEEYDAEYAHYVNAGYEAAASVYINGVGRAHFFDALHDFGFFFETVETSPALYQMLQKMHRNHLTWDGKTPIRDFAEILPSA